MRTQSLVSLIAHEIEGTIVRGDIGPGERINEFQLALRFQTSRGPIREALRGLQQAGLLEARRNRGVFVREIADAEALDIYEVRAVLFGLAGQLLAKRITKSELSALTQLHRQMGKSVRANDPVQYFPINLAFHTMIVSCCGNATLQTQYSELVKKLHLCRSQSLSQSGNLKTSNDEHAALLEALAAGDPERAFRAHAAHVLNAKARFCALVEAHRRSSETVSSAEQQGSPSRAKPSRDHRPSLPLRRSRPL